MASRVREAETKKRGGTQGERESEKTDHSAVSDEPDACCYADHGEGKWRERRVERAESRRRGGEAWTPAPIEFSLSQVRLIDGRAAAVKRSGMPRKERGNPCSPSLTLLVFRRFAVSLRDSGPFINIQSVCVCVCVQSINVCVSVARTKQILS